MASYGDWQFMIGVIKSSYFDNKEHFDNTYAPQGGRFIDEFMDKSAEQELFYKTMCKLFREEVSDDDQLGQHDEHEYDKAYMLKDFRVLSYDGNDTYATAQRGNYYLTFYHIL